MVTNALLIPNEQILTNSTDSYMIPGNNNFPNPAGRPTVSVIIPTLNEAKNIPYILPYLPMEWIDEVILVDGRSTDDTIEVARQILPSVKIVLERRKGKGIAMQAGYNAAQGDIIVMVDADGSNDPREIPSFILKLMEGA
ncbi:MAG: glycosyltransferase family 2 protein, partial [Anaerolineales bacterium]|nr:glycosyltransferase family 2 protein [Anaerolineales bacterium]